MPSISFGKICFSKILPVIVSHMKIIFPPQFFFLSNLYSLEKPSLKNTDSEKVSLSFVSVTPRMSIYFSIVSFNCSNLFLIELIFTLAIITLSAFPIRSSFILLKEFGVVLMDFFSDWSTKNYLWRNSFLAKFIKRCESLKAKFWTNRFSSRYEPP